MTVVIETERLILREIDIERDFTPMEEMFSDRDTVRYLGNKIMTGAVLWRYMATMIGHQQVRGYGFYSVIEKATDQWVGRVGPWYPMGWPSPEIGWAIHPAHTGKGFAKEAARACVAHVFDTLGWEKVIHVIIKGNVASERTALSIGSEKIGELAGIPAITDEPCWVYGQNRPARS